MLRITFTLAFLAFTILFAAQPASAFVNYVQVEVSAPLVEQVEGNVTNGPVLCPPNDPSPLPVCGWPICTFQCDYGETSCTSHTGYGFGVGVSDASGEHYWSAGVGILHPPLLYTNPGVENYVTENGGPGINGAITGTIHDFRDTKCTQPTS